MTDPAEITFFTVQNFYRWGKLIIKWARDPASRPTKISAFIADLQEYGVGGSVPSRYQNIAFVQSAAPEGSETPAYEISVKSNTLFIMLPELDVLKYSEQQLNELDPSPFPQLLPNFFPVDFDAKDITRSTPPDSRLFRFVERIGDYTSANCLTYNGTQTGGALPQENTNFGGSPAANYPA